MKLSLVLFFIFSLTGCGSLANGLAELTGLSFLHDRRSSAVIALDENIEDSAITRQAILPSFFYHVQH
jgi:hypothetical protein